MQTITFITSFLTFYLKGEIKHEKNFVKLRIPNTILGFIPLGSHNKTIAVNQISSVSTDFRVFFKNLVIGAIIALVGLSLFGDSFFGGLLVTAFGVLMVLNSLQTALVLTLTSGEVIPVFFVIFEKAKAGQAEEAINNLIAGRMDDTNSREQTDRIVDAINNK